MQKDGWFLQTIDTGRYADYLSEEEKDVILAMNALRSDPPKFARLYVYEIMGYYDGNQLRYPGEIPILTFEGVAAVRELYDQLMMTYSLSVLYPSRGMSRAARDHSYEQSLTGRTSHNGKDGSDPFTRLNRYGRWETLAAENIAYGKNDGLRIVLQLAIDDGVTPRGHRTNLLDPRFMQCGVGIAAHPEYGSSCTIDYTAQYMEM